MTRRLSGVHGQVQPIVGFISDSFIRGDGHLQFRQWRTRSLEPGLPVCKKGEFQYFVAPVASSSKCLLVGIHYIAQRNPSN